jgi:hypothetical protein
LGGNKELDSKTFDHGSSFSLPVTKIRVWRSIFTRMTCRRAASSGRETVYNGIFEFIKLVSCIAGYTVVKETAIED